MLAKVRDLPPASTAGLKLLGLLNQPEIGNDDVVRVVKQDAVLTAKLLRACNSPALGLKEPTMSVDHAVLILGHRQLFQMVTGLAFRGLLSGRLCAYALDDGALWCHSLLAATAAELALADGLDLDISTPTAFTLGLLHDLGKLITSQFLDWPSMVAMRRHRAQGRSLCQAERDVLGTDHAEVGAGLLYLWHLPAQIVEAAALHHQPVYTPRPQASALVWFADLVAHRAEGTESSGEILTPQTGSEVLAALNSNPEKLDSLVGRVCQQARQSSELLSVVHGLGPAVS
jgi:putative nucleotidyltransferase with HDIG domain